MQVTAGVTGAISFSGAAVGRGGPYWGAELAAATSTNSEIMAGFDWIGLRECVADGYKSWRSDYPVGKPGHAGSRERLKADLTDFIFCPRPHIGLGLPALQENFHNFQKGQRPECKMYHTSKL